MVNDEKVQNLVKNYMLGYGLIDPLSKQLFSLYLSLYLSYSVSKQRPFQYNCYKYKLKNYWLDFFKNLSFVKYKQILTRETLFGIILKLS